MSDASVPVGHGPTSEPDVDFDAAYREVPPWEIGAPQPVLARLAEEGWFVDPVLDVGCGTGENALELAGALHRNIHTARKTLSTSS